MRSTDTNGRALCAGITLFRSPEGQNQVVGRHRYDFEQRQAGGIGEVSNVSDIAHAPFGITLAQTGIEHGIADRGVLAVALEGSVEI